MIVDPSLWTAFHIAKDALIGALETPIPECGHILAYPPADREQFRSDVQRTIDALAEELRQIRLVQARLSETQNYLVKSVGEAQLALSPVGLPVELLESVVNYAAGPERHRTIIYLSHVCSRWRSIVLGERSLFTHADWNRWPTWLLELWCSRSRGAPLTIELRSRALERIEDAGEERYSQTLLATKPFWESIRVEGSASLDPARYDFLFSSPLPSLCQLEFHSTTLSFRKPIQFTILSSPHLRTLSVTGTVPRSEQSLSELRELTLVPTFRTPWYMWTEILRSVPSLVCLTLTSTAGLMMDLSGRHFTLPSLTSLVLMHERQPRSPPLFTSLLSVFSFPNLKSAKLVHFSNELYQSVPLLTALVSACIMVYSHLTN